MIASGAVSVGQEVTEAVAQVTKAQEITQVAQITKIGCVFGGCRRDEIWDSPFPVQTAAPFPLRTAIPVAQATVVM